MDNGQAHNLVPDPADPDQLMPSFALPQAKPMLLTAMPMPPSMNHAYASVEIAGVQRRVKGDAMRAYERDCATWALANSSALRQVRAEIAEIRARYPGRTFGVASDFWFLRENVLTTKGLPKRNDVSNRIKALHDQLSQLIGLDDCWFWGVTACKRVLAPGKRIEYVDVIVTLVAE